VSLLDNTDATAFSLVMALLSHKRNATYTSKCLYSNMAVKITIKLDGLICIFYNTDYFHCYIEE
jgi:hypothetical protein